MKKTTKKPKGAVLARETEKTPFLADELRAMANELRTMANEGFARLDQIQKTLYEIRDLLRENRGPYEYRIHKWTETPGWNKAPTPPWPPSTTAPHYPTDPYGGPIVYCGTAQAHSGDYQGR